MPARFLIKLASNQGILWVNPLKSGVTFTSDNIKQKMEAVGVGSYLIGLNPKCRSLYWLSAQCTGREHCLSHPADSACVSGDQPGGACVGGCRAGRQVTLKCHLVLCSTSWHLSLILFCCLSTSHLLWNGTYMQTGWGLVQQNLPHSWSVNIALCGKLVKAVTFGV
jgi:hypothetical protein